jgi:hypothetical protein
MDTLFLVAALVLVMVGMGLDVSALILVWNRPKGDALTADFTAAGSFMATFALVSLLGALVVGRV